MGCDLVTEKIRLGLEEEVFVTEPDRPSLQSLYYLARLLWRNPGYYYRHSASNFARGRDVAQGLMGGIEISTGVHEDPDDLLRDLASRRRELARVTAGLIVPVGHLFDVQTPTNTCGLHIHVGPLADPRRAYAHLVHFLPLLALMSANSPLAGGEARGLSYRMQVSFAIGPLREDWTHRFQDLIYSCRLGTLELRVFDPFWDLERLRWLLRCIVAVAALPGEREPDLVRYNRLREQVARRGYTDELRSLYRELAAIVPVPEHLFAEPPAQKALRFYRRHGLLATYAAIDNAYRTGRFAAPGGSVGAEQPAALSRAALAAAGFLGYYMVKLPYVVIKARREWAASGANDLAGTAGGTEGRRR